MGSGGATAGGSGGQTAVVVASPATPPACDPSLSALGKIAAPAPLISVGKPVAASSGVTNPAKAVDGLYAHSGTFLPAPTAASPAWLAIDLGVGPTRVLLSWADVGWNDYNTPVPGGSPASYRIETSADSTDGANGTWHMAVDVPTNTVRERAHAFPFQSQRWVRVTVTAAANVGGLNPGVSFDEIAVRDVSSGTADAPPADTWFFMGDSITAGGFRRQLGAGTGFDELIHAARPAYSPAFLDGGIGGELSTMGVGHLDDWLAFNPDVEHIAILYGTNDSWGVATATSSNLTAFVSNMTTLVEKILAAGRVPILARIPYAVMAHPDVGPFNAAIDDISTTHSLPCGPDFYGWFAAHPEELSSDGVHPSDVGYRSINRLWADAMLGRYPSN